MVRIAIQSAFIATVIGLASAGLVKRDLPTASLKKVSTITNIKNIVDRDNARLNHYYKKVQVAGNEDASAPVINEIDSYIAEVKVGSQTFNLIVDTGSSNTWVGASTTFTAGSTGKSTGDAVSVSYGSGSFSGTEYTDTVSVGGSSTSKQSIGVASTATGFTGVDGIIGFGPVDLTESTVTGATTVPTFLENLKSSGVISTNVLGVSFAPESGSDSNDSNGELTFGGVDSTKYTGSITYTPAVAPYWGVAVSEFKFGTTTVGSSSYSGIVDTGTTLIYVPTAVYTKYLKASGGKLDATTGLVKTTKKPTKNFSLVVGGTTFTLTPDQYLVPEAQYTNFGISGTGYYSYINDGGSSSPDTILGMTFLENYYSVFDTDNSRIGLATAA
jgi:hypothetical protein